MECVTTTSLSVLINGSPSKPFKMERGMRQGDPISLFLFVLIVDVLHKMVGEAVRNGRISPLVVGRDSIELSHLQFADDTILFCPPKEETMKNCKRLLRCFELISGLSINFDKSILIPFNCEDQLVQHMCSLLGCKEGTLPVKYLRIPLRANPRLIKTWKPIIDKVEEKLSLWKAKVLNKAGKLVLIKSINNLSVYYLSLYKIPKAVAEKLISLQRRFLWSKEDRRNGMALEECPLCKKVLCSCNNLNSNELLSTQMLPTRGGLWKDICQVQIKEQHIRDKMITGLSMEIGDGGLRILGWIRMGLKLLMEAKAFSVGVGSSVSEEILPEDVTSYSFTKTI
ncbi:uncharacterized protein LOC107627664 [Arachis ipaensis]|uniref:uncharacterized protein LOC107627664 n=1 Tax=Arachis ipaensis TaxID=130454 RepID=UPI0007AFD813|nr:uncharacterized protein LOC107627664 [Arachis ipaensis]